MSLRMLSLSVACLCAAAVAQAAPPNLKPGLWEVKAEGDMPAIGGAEARAQAEAQMAEMRAQLAKMPPEQRRMMEQHMGQMGLGIDTSAQGKGMAMRICLTAEDIRREALPMSDDGNDCEHKVVTRSDKRWVAQITCREPQMSGTAEAVFDSATAYRVNVKGTVKEGGKSQPFDSRMSWTHVSSNCGNVKPMSATVPAAPARR